ncbi:RNA-binding protein rsd1 [Pleurostoma richardsiae]|uniref:RNA-binding protein rsd1 n=1 Tax=Pleurostoma richardsiae TaxID=41990 RepID=A0AA38VE26_9PEZI|nr:RNA-binding protein rsd1 [Pleurostoma richardsiae]
MAYYDVEALLDATANQEKESAKDSDAQQAPTNGDSQSNGDRRDRDRARESSRERERDRDRDRGHDRRRRDRSPSHRDSTSAGDRTPRSEAGSHRKEMEIITAAVVATVAPAPAPRAAATTALEIAGTAMTTAASEEIAARTGRKTVLANLPALQLAARLRTRELKEFFEKVGPVTEAQIVKDRVSNRSKGVGYVEFKNEDSVTAALQLTGQKLLGIPVIVQLTEAEKNRQVRNSEGGGHPNSIPFHRLYVGNIHFSITEQDLQNVFEPFGELEFVQLQKDENGRSRGYGFVQFRDAGQAREALEKMNGFDLAGRPIRVGLGNDKFTPESTANLLQRFQGQNQQYQGSAFSGAGGRGQAASNFDRAGGRDNEKGGGASALDDTDVAGVNFNNYSRDALMRKLARTDEPSTGNNDRQILKPKTEAPKPLPVNVNMASRCVVLHNMFDPDEEEGENWIKELEDDVREEAESKYGHVVHIALDANSKGDIYLKFDKVQGGENAIKGLNGRYFGGRMITAAPVVDAVYSSLFSRSKAI